MCAWAAQITAQLSVAEVFSHIDAQIREANRHQHDVNFKQALISHKHAAHRITNGNESRRSAVPHSGDKAATAGRKVQTDRRPLPSTVIAHRLTSASSAGSSLNAQHLLGVVDGPMTMTTSTSCHQIMAGPTTDGRNKSASAASGSSGSGSTCGSGWVSATAGSGNRATQGRVTKPPVAPSRGVKGRAALGGKTAPAAAPVAAPATAPVTIRVRGATTDDKMSQMKEELAELRSKRNFAPVHWHSCRHKPRRCTDRCATLREQLRDASVAENARLEEAIARAEQRVCTAAAN